MNEQLTHLEARIAEVESRFLAMRAENTRLRSATVHARPDGSSADAPPGGVQGEELRGGRPMRLAVLEAERQEIRSRIRSLIEVL